MAVFYDRPQINQWLGKHTVQKANGYRAKALRWEGTTLRGRVQGSRRHAYEVKALFHVDARRTFVEGRCSCPVGYNCKHVAAVLLTNLEHPGTPDTGIRSEVMEWLETLRRAEDVPSAKKAKPAAKATHALLYVLVEETHGETFVRIFKARLNSEGTVQAIEAAWSNIDARSPSP